MRFAIDGNHKRYFRQNGWLEAEALLTEEEAKKLLSAIQEILFNYPGNRFERGRYISRSLSKLTALIRRKQFGELVYELTDARPLRLAEDIALHQLTPDQKKSLKNIVESGGSHCYLLLCLNGEKQGNGFFFRNSSFDAISFENDGWYFLLGFSTQLLNEDFFPLIYK